MMKKGMMWKGLVVGIIILFIGVSFAPTINFNIVRASAEDEFFEVTTQALGIKGYEDTTVKLTREQYHNLISYLDSVYVRINQTTTKEEAIPILKEAVLELNQYGLLPNGMTIKQSQDIISGKTINLNQNKIPSWHDDLFFNILCLVCGWAEYSFSFGLLSILSIALAVSPLFIIGVLLAFLSQLNPFLFLNSILSLNAVDLLTLGIFGKQVFEGIIGIFLFTGFKIVTKANFFPGELIEKAFYLGLALGVSEFLYIFP